MMPILSLPTPALATVKRVSDKPLILIKNYIGDPCLDDLFNHLTSNSIFQVSWSKYENESSCYIWQAGCPVSVSLNYPDITENELLVSVISDSVCLYLESRFIR